MISGAGLLQVQSYEKNCYQTVLSIVQIIHTFNASNMVVWTIGYFECEKTCCSPVLSLKLYQRRKEMDCTTDLSSQPSAPKLVTM